MTQTRFLANVKNDVIIIHINEIAAFIRKVQSVWIICLDGRQYPIDGNLTEIVKCISSKDFFKINRQHIICISAIDKMQIVSHSRILITLKEPLKLQFTTSRDRTCAFKEWLTY